KSCLSPFDRADIAKSRINGFERLGPKRCQHPELSGAVDHNDLRAALPCERRSSTARVEPVARKHRPTVRGTRPGSVAFVEKEIRPSHCSHDVRGASVRWPSEKCSDLRLK